MKRELKKQKKRLRILALLLMSTMTINGCVQTSPTSDVKPTESNNKVEYNPTEPADNKSAESTESTSDTTDSTSENANADVSAEFNEETPTVDTDPEESQDESGQTGERDHQGELIPPKHSTSKTPPKNPTEEDIGVEGDDTWYMQVRNTVIPNFEKHIGEDIEFSLNKVKFRLSYSLGELLSILKENNWDIMGNPDRVMNEKFEPGSEMSLTVGNGGETVMTVKAFNPYRNTYVKPADFQPYYYSINVDRLKQFNFLNIHKNTNLYDYQFIKKSVQFPIRIDEALIFCQVETGLGYAGLYDTGTNYLAGFIYFLSDEEKEAMIKEEYNE